MEVWTAEKLPWLIAEGAVDSATEGAAVSERLTMILSSLRSPRRTMRNRLILSFAGFCGLALHLILTVPTFFWPAVPRAFDELSVFASPMRDFGGGPLAVLDFLSPFEQVAAAAIWRRRSGCSTRRSEACTGRTIDSGASMSAPHIL